MRRRIFRIGVTVLLSCTGMLGLATAASAHNVPSSISTQVSTTSYNVGTTPGAITDAATVTGIPLDFAPTGTVNFFVCGPTPSPASCTSGTPEGSPTLAAGSGVTSTAVSSPFTPTLSGTYCFAAYYVPDGQTFYDASSDNTTSPPDTTECVSVTAPLVNIVKSVTPISGTVVAQGSTLAYALAITNAGSGAASSFVVSDSVPAGSSYVASSASCNTLANCTASGSGNSVSFAISSMPSGASGNVTFSVVVGATDTSPISNFATYTGSGCTMAGGTCTTNTVTNAIGPQFTVVKSEPSPGDNDEVTAGQTAISYALTLANGGGTATGAVAVTDSVPAGTTYVDGSATCGSAPNCTASESGNVVDFSLSSVAPGATNIALGFTVKVNSGDPNGMEIPNVARFTNVGNSACTTATCLTNQVQNKVVEQEVAAAQKIHTKPATQAVTVRSSKPIAGATTVHTGEPWAGTASLEVAASLVGLVLAGAGVLTRRRRRSRPSSAASAGPQVSEAHQHSSSDTRSTWPFALISHRDDRN